MAKNDNRRHTTAPPYPVLGFEALIRVVSAKPVANELAVAESITLQHRNRNGETAPARRRSLLLASQFTDW